jgi:predicted nucleic acid-binding protein
MIPLDDALAHQAASVAAQYRLPGGDAVYAAVALRFGSTLVTLDREQRNRVGAALTTCYPSEALTQVSRCTNVQVKDCTNG